MGLSRYRNWKEKRNRNQNSSRGFMLRATVRRIFDPGYEPLRSLPLTCGNEVRVTLDIKSEAAPQRTE
jgi:hypothetical protein